MAPIPRQRTFCGFVPDHSSAFYQFPYPASHILSDVQLKRNEILLRNEHFHSEM